MIAATDALTSSSRLTHHPAGDGTSHHACGVHPGHARPVIAHPGHVAPVVLHPRVVPEVLAHPGDIAPVLMHERHLVPVRLHPRPHPWVLLCPRRCLLPMPTGTTDA